MSDQLEVLKFVAARLDAVSIPYMITGSLAVSHYATPRLTRDIDLVVDLDRLAADRLVTSLGSDFYVEEHALGRAADSTGMANIIHLRLLVKVDLIVRKDTPYRREEFRRLRERLVRSP